MTTFPDRDDQTTSSGTTLKRFASALVGLVIGQILVDKSDTIAKLLVYLSHGPNIDKWRVAQMSLVVIFVFICADVGLGAFVAKRGWVAYE